MNPAGWFPDPTGRFGQRWHDGTTWTDWVIGANGAKVQDALQAGGPPASPGFTPTAAGPAPYAPGPTGYAPDAGAARYAPGAGLVISGIGLLLVALSLFVLKWTAADQSKFHDLSKAVRAAGTSAVHNHAEYLYIAWAGYVLFAVAAVFTVLAGIPIPASAAGNRYSRVVASLAAGGAAVLHTTVVAELFHGNAKEAKPGSWIAVVGYVAVLVGMVIGARRVRPRRPS